MRRSDKRKIQAIVVATIMILIGILITGKLSESILDHNDPYNKAIRISDPELFKYAMSTNAGNAFVQGDWKVLDPVTDAGIEGEYSEILKIYEEYTMHTRVVTTTDSKGRVKTKTETYWTWDETMRMKYTSEKCEFLGVEFDTSKFSGLDLEHTDTVKLRSDYRVKYYTSPTQVTSTVYTNLEDNTVAENSRIFADKTIEECYNKLITGKSRIIVFWTIWIIATLIITYKIITNYYH